MKSEIISLFVVWVCAGILLYLIQILPFEATIVRVLRGIILIVAVVYTIFVVISLLAHLT